MSVIIPIAGTLIEPALPPGHRITSVIKHSGSDPNRYDVLVEIETKPGETSNPEIDANDELDRPSIRTLRW